MSITGMEGYRKSYKGHAIAYIEHRLRYLLIGFIVHTVPTKWVQPILLYTYIVKHCRYCKSIAYQ